MIPRGEQSRETVSTWFDSLVEADLVDTNLTDELMTFNFIVHANKIS